jgi:hypothetical protein
VEVVSTYPWEKGDVMYVHAYHSRFIFEEVATKGTKVTEELMALTPESDCDQMTMGLPSVTSAVLLKAKSFCYKVGFLAVIQN